EECLEPEQALVEGARPIEVIHVEGGFEDAAGSRYRSHGLLHATGGFVSLARRRPSTRRATSDWPPTWRVRSRVRQKVRITGAHRKIGAAARRLRTRARRRSPRAGDGTTPHRTRAPRAPRRHLWDHRRRTPADGCERSWRLARTSGRAPGSPPDRNPAAGARPAPLPPSAAPAVPHAPLRRAALRPHCPRERGWCRPARPRPRRSAPPHRWRPPALRPEPRPLPPPEWAPGKAGLSWLPPDSQPALAVRPFVKRLNRFGREGGGFALRGLRDDKRAREEPPRRPQAGQRRRDQRAPIGRVQEHESGRFSARYGENIQRQYLRNPLRPTRRDVRAQRSERDGVDFDERRMTGAARQSLQPQCPRSGEDVQHLNP